MQYRLNEINILMDYFIAEICKRETMSKSLSKHKAELYHFDKTLLVLSATGRSVHVASFATIIGASVGIPSPSLGLVFSITDGIAKKTYQNNDEKENNNTQ